MTEDEISECLAACDSNKKTVAIRGGGTLEGIGFPVQADESVSTRGLNRITEDTPSDSTVTVQSGVTLRTLSNALAMHGSHVPFDAPRPDSATVGGTLAAGWLGPRRHIYGRARDFFFGSTAILADGTVAGAGGTLAENVSGYDMSRLYVGSFGTLCVLARANLKTVPAPSDARLFLARLPEMTRSRAIAQMRLLPVPPSAAFWIDGFHKAIDGDDGAQGRMFVFLEGSSDAIDGSTRDLRSALGRAGVPETRIIDAEARAAFERVIDAYIACVGERSITYRLATVPEDGEQAVLDTKELAARFELRVDAILDAMNGDAIVRVSDLNAHALASKMHMFDDALHDAQPTAIVIAGDHPNRPTLRVWGELPPAFHAMQVLKARFDPNGTLNPGRFVRGI
ncbi:MAG: FAD-binding oxidoreductase [Candidatus Eremiobacteraeota bacterium]|nr:FAD-binding oxidoreductase [Candidatus Eremiobacteraeota bacterium]